MKRLVIAAIVLGAMVGNVATASAVPKTRYTVACGDNPLVLEVSTGRGIWAAQQVAGQNSHFIPASISFQVIAEDDTVLASRMVTKNGHRRQDQTVCTFEDHVSSGGQTLTIRGEASVVKGP